jgi:hypothetical protein
LSESQRLKLLCDTVYVHAYVDGTSQEGEYTMGWSPAKDRKPAIIICSKADQVLNCASGNLLVPRHAEASAPASACATATASGVSRPMSRNRRDRPPRAGPEVRSRDSVRGRSAVLRSDGGVGKMPPEFTEPCKKVSARKMSCPMQRVSAHVDSRMPIGFCSSMHSISVF